MNSISSNLKSQHPAAWSDLIEYYQEKYNAINLTFEELPFEFQLGVFLKFFEENAVSPDFQALDFDSLATAVAEAFSLYAHLRNHHS